jgi:hypothetical protein
MAKDHEHEEHGSRLERLVEGVQDALLHTERENAARHIELMAALQGKPDFLGKLNALGSRLCKIAKALKALDDAT